METITNVIDHSLNINNYLNKNSCFVDIETTGLSRKNNMIYLIGLLYFDFNRDTWILEQYFANSMEKEGLLLKEFISNISKFDHIITYNGNSFDLPFIDNRLSYHNIKYSIDKSKSFDLYQIIKQNKIYLNLENLKLKTIEESLGFIREDKYSGYDCIGFYYDYIRSKDPILKIDILKHNYDDLVHMLDIMIILDVLDGKKSFNLGSNKFTIENIDIIGDILRLSGIIKIPLKKDIKFYGNSYDIFTNNLDRFTFSMEFKEGYITKEDKCIYIDLLDFPTISIKDNSGYNLPPNIFVLLIEKDYCMDNIKTLLTNIFNDIFI
jgi:uncharacterized protein YprB with RNaseH-like and TPR domain